MSAINEMYIELGRENSVLGSPTSEEQEVNDGSRIRYFEYGLIRSKTWITPLKFLQQNLSLLPVAVRYPGIDRERAIDSFVNYLFKLKERSPDIVGLSGCFVKDEREQIQTSLDEIYPYSREGPQGPTEGCPILDNQHKPLPKADGGLLLLSKYPFIEDHQTVFPQCVGGFLDCCVNKGVIHGRVEVPAHVTTYDIFLCQLQNNSDNSDETARKVIDAQLGHLNSFVQAYSNPQRPALLMGDLSTDAHDYQLFMPWCPTTPSKLIPGIYHSLIERLTNPADLWLTSSHDGSGITLNDPKNSFHYRRSRQPIDHPRRFQNGTRQDYFLSWRGARFWPGYSNTKLLVLQGCKGRDISDHYGLTTQQENLRELAVEIDHHIGGITLNTSKVHCMVATAKHAPPELLTERGPDNVVFTLNYRGTGPDWHHRNLTQLLGLPGVFGNLKVYNWEQVNRNKPILYRNQEGHIFLFWYEAASTPTKKDLTVEGQAPICVGDPHGYIRSDDNSQHIVFRDKDDGISELWFKTGSKRWTHRYLTTESMPKGASNPTGYTWKGDGPADNPQPSQHVIYRDANGHLHELKYTLGPNWTHQDLTNEIAGPLAVGNPVGYAWEHPTYRSQHIIYRGTDNRIYELYQTYNNPWRLTRLTEHAGAPQAAGAPIAYVWEAQASQHVIYRGEDGHIHELLFKPGAGWRYQDLTNLTGLPLAGSDPTSYVWEADNIQHILFQGTDGHIYDLYQREQNWQYLNITAITNAPLAMESPVGYTSTDDEPQHVLYRDAAGTVHELRYRQGSGTFERTLDSIRVDGVQTGEVRQFGDQYLAVIENPVESLELTITGRRGNTRLGSSTLQFEQEELRMLIRRSSTRIFPLLTGAAGEYAVSLTISVQEADY